MAKEPAARRPADDEGDPRDREQVLEGEVLGRADGPSSAANALQALNDADAGLAATLTRAEIDQQIATAKRYPRQVSVVQKNIETLATLDPQTAQESIYVLPRGGKKITGPSVRFAEIVAQAWGNCRLASRVTNVGKTHIEATGIYHDLETNVAFAKAVTVRITKANGQRYDDDMIGVASQAAISKALRNAILAGVPKGVWRVGLDKAIAVIAGTTATLAQRRIGMVKKMGEDFGAKPAEIFQVLGVADLADVTIGHMVQLAGIYTSLETQEARWADIVAESTPAGKTAGRTLGDANGPKTEPAKAAPKAAAGKAAATTAPAEDPKATGGPETGADVEKETGAADATGGEAEERNDDAADADTTTGADGDAATTEGDDSALFNGDDDADADGVEADADEDTVDPHFATFQTALETVTDWDGARSAIHALAGSTYWADASDVHKNAAYRMAWGAMPDGAAPDHRKMPPVWRLWLEAQDDDKAIEDSWLALASSTAYGKLPQTARDDLIKAKRNRIAAIRGGDQ